MIKYQFQKVSDNAWYVFLHGEYVCTVERKRKGYEVIGEAIFNKERSKAVDEFLKVYGYNTREHFIKSRQLKAV